MKTLQEIADALHELVSDLDAHLYLQLRHRIEELPTSWQGSASGPIAPSSSEAPQQGSARPNTSEPTTASASARPEPGRSQTPEPSSGERSDAPAPSAPETADQGVADLGRDPKRRTLLDMACDRWCTRNLSERCATCSSLLPAYGVRNVKVWTPNDHIHLLACTSGCAVSLQIQAAQYWPQEAPACAR